RCVFCGFCVDVCPVDALKETRVHDLVFNSRKDLIFDPDKFNQDVDEVPLVDKPVRKVKAVVDENRGIKYVPDSS
ncbi:MAG: 4Fe-4S binding protein, partial [Saccharolobus sp.]